MHVSAYMALTEEAFDRPDELARLRGSSERDPELDETERVQVQGRIDRYRGDEARRFADQNGEVEIGAED